MRRWTFPALGILLFVTCTSPPEPNQAPVIDALLVAHTTLAQNATTTLTLHASDPDGDPLEITWEATGHFVVLPDFDPRTATLLAPNDAGAQGRITATVTDPEGASARASVDVTTNANQNPELTNLHVHPEGPLDPGATATLTAIAADPDADPLTYLWSSSSSEWELRPADSTAELSAPPSFGASTTVSVVVSDPEGASRESTVVLTTRTNRPPSILSLEAQPPQPQPGSVVTLTALATDPEDHPLTYAWSAPDGWVLSGSGDELELTVPSEPGVEGTVSLEISDGFGGSDLTSLALTTATPRGPNIVSLTASPNPVERGGTVVLEAEVIDPDGAPLRYFWKSTDFAWTLDPSDTSTATVHAPPTPEATARIELTVLDAENLSARASIGVSTAGNQAPLIQALSPAGVTPVLPGSSVRVDLEATDPEGDPLSARWAVSSPDWIVVSPSITGADLFAPKTLAATTTVTVVVEDDAGDSVTATFDLSTDTVCPQAHVSQAGRCVPCGQDVIVRDHPIIQYRLDDAPGATQTPDISGHNRPGTLPPDIVLGLGSVMDEPGASARLSGNLEGIHFSPMLSFPPGAFSLEMWLRTSSGGPGQTLLRYTTASAPNALRIHNPSSLRVTLNDTPLETQVAVDDGLWHLLHVTWRSSDGALTIYVDGAPAFAGTLAAGYALGDGGALAFGEGLEAIVDELAYYKNALSAQAVAEHLVAMTCDERCTGLDDDGDGAVDEGWQGSEAACPAASCEALGAANAYLGPGSYWIGVTSSSASIAVCE